MNKMSHLSQWQSSLLITIVVLITVLSSLLMAQYDTLQQRSLIPARQLPLFDEQPTEQPANSQYSPLPYSENVPSASMDTVKADTAVSPIESCPTTPVAWQAYKVRPGDTLAKLARQHKTTTSILRTTNCLPNNKIIVGQHLFLPPQET